jgi:dissimilatory sulfite reductase (desulfoviridin) alpha/beta subunit
MSLCVPYNPATWHCAEVMLMLRMSCCPASCSAVQTLVGMGFLGMVVTSVASLVFCCLETAILHACSHKAHSGRCRLLRD